MPSLKTNPLLDGDSAKDDAVAYTDGPPLLFLLFLLLVALLLLLPLLPLPHRHPLFFFQEPGLLTLTLLTGIPKENPTR